MSEKGNLVEDDLACFREIKQDSKDAFKFLYIRYFDKLHAFALTLTADHFLAEEAVQEVFIRIWEKRRTITIHSSVQYYLYRSCRNMLFNLLQRRAAQTQELTDEEPVAVYSSPADLLAFKHLNHDFQTAVSQLPERAKAVFLLRFYQQQKHREIARQLEISESMVEKHWANALKQLQKKLAAYFFQ